MIGIFKNYANIIKDHLASSKSPYVSKKFVASTANWSTWLLEVTLDESGLHNYISQQQCDDNTKTPLELACSLMLHKPMVLLTSQELYDVEQLYNCLLLCTINSDIEGFNIILSKFHGNNSCEVIKKNCSGAVLSRTLRNIYLSSFDVAHFHCKRSNNCIMYDYVCGTLRCHQLCSHQLTDMLSAHYTELSDTHHEQQLFCPYDYVNVISGYHGWRTGFTMETDKCEIPSVDIRQLGEEMLKLFSGIKQPLVIKGVGSDWNLSIKWTRKYLQKYFGSIEVLVRVCMYVCVCMCVCMHVCMSLYVCCV